jgi:hypothetical protein
MMALKDDDIGRADSGADTAVGVAALNEVLEGGHLPEPGRSSLSGPDVGTRRPGHPAQPPGRYGTATSTGCAPGHAITRNPRTKYRLTGV